MPRYYFHLEGRRDVILDEEGVEVRDAEQAIKEASAAVEEMREDGEFEGADGGWALVVRDGQGNEIRRIAI